jgi:hypothetical protein
MRNAELLNLARAVLIRNQPKIRDSAWDSRGTPTETLSQCHQPAGTVKTEVNQQNNARVPLSHALGDGTLGQQQNPGTPPGTVAGHPYAGAVAALRSTCPAFVDKEDWQQAITDSDNFLAKWAAHADGLGWSAQNLFGLHSPPEQPGPRYRRLSRVDCAGLIWLLRGRAVVALTQASATIGTNSGGALIYRKGTAHE